jgi:Domain of unknown function (DUF222)
VAGSSVKHMFDKGDTKAGSVPLGSADRSTGDEASDTVMIERMLQLQRMIAAGEAELAAAMHEFTTARPDVPAAARDLDAEFAIDEMAAAMRWSRRRVREQVHRVSVLRRNLPDMWATWRIGRADQAKVKLVVDTAERIADDNLLPSFDVEAAQVAIDKTWGQLASWVNRWVAAAEPDQFEARYRRAFAERAVRTSSDLDGMGRLWATTNAVELTEIDYRLTKLAQKLGADDPRTLEQRRADIFVNLLTGRRSTTLTGTSDGASDATGEQPGSAPQPNGEPDSKSDKSGDSIRLAVTVPIQSLLGLDETPGMVADGSTAVPASVVQQIASRPGTLFYRLLTDQRGNLLDVAQLGRFPNALLGFGVQMRDRTCRFPGCTRPAIGCDGDHTLPHPDGETIYSNLGCLCRRHHRAKHSPGFGLRQVQPGRFEWTTPSGHHYRVAAEPLPVGRWPNEPDSRDPPKPWHHDPVTADDLAEFLPVGEDPEQLTPADIAHILTG